MFGVAPFATLPIASIPDFERNESASIAIGSEAVMRLDAGDEAVWSPKIGSELMMRLNAGDEMETR